MRPYKLEDLQFAAPYFSAIDCVLNKEEAIYCSSELSSGFRLYKELRSHKLKSDTELKRVLGDDWYKKNIWNKNVDSANAFASSIRRARKGEVVITPAPLKVKDWGQPDYTAFWDELIRTRVREVHFNKNWEYSNGCTAEMVGALDADIPAFDADGNRIHLETAISRVQSAVEELLKGELDTQKLEINFHHLISLRSQSSLTTPLELTEMPRSKTRN
jgi:hypothetical protein